MDNFVHLHEILQINKVITYTECWSFLGKLKTKWFWINKKIYPVHRISAHLYKNLDILDSSICVCHHCDNNWCYNPDHLFLGTQVDNIKDMDKKGRRRSSHRPISEEHKKAISKANKGRKRPDLVGRMVSKETREKLSEAHKGKKFSKEHRKKLSEARRKREPWNKGFTYSKEHKANIVAANKARKGS